MATVTCTRCGKEAPGLDGPPFNDDLGREIAENTCAACWKDWLGLQVKIINEYGLIPPNPEHAAILEENLKEFLQLPSAPDGDVTEVGDPPSRD